MVQITNPERVEEMKDIARKRYHSIRKSDYGPAEVFQDNAIMRYHTTADGINCHIVEIDKGDADSDDVGAVLEWVLHDIADRTASQYLDEMLYSIMGAVKLDELDEALRENNEYTELDLGYVIPGLLDTVDVAIVDDEPDTEEYCPSSTAGDYSPSCPWNAPGMSISDFI